MRVISVCLQKGGTGKTSVAISLSAELARKSRVVLIETDPQGNASSTLLKSLQYELCDVLRGKCFLKDAIQKTSVENLFVLPTAAISDGNGLRLYRETEAIRELNIFEDVREELEKLGFDYCVFDTSPAFATFEENIYTATDEMIAVLQPDKDSQDGLETFITSLKDFRRRRMHKQELPVLNTIVMNNVNHSMSITNAILDILSNQKTFNIIEIPQDQAFKRAQMNGTVVHNAEPKSETLESISKLADLVRG